MQITARITFIHNASTIERLRRKEKKKLVEFYLRSRGEIRIVVSEFVKFSNKNLMGYIFYRFCGLSEVCVHDSAKLGYVGK